MSTIFHKIVSGEAPCYKVHENEEYLAFLDIFPAVSSPGQVVVVPKQFQPSKLTAVDTDTLSKATLFAQDVAKLMESKLENVLRVIAVIEGLQIDYFHIKLYPVYDGIHLNINEVARLEDAELERLQGVLTA